LREKLKISIRNQRIFLLDNFAIVSIEINILIAIKVLADVHDTVFGEFFFQGVLVKSALLAPRWTHFSEALLFAINGILSFRFTSFQLLLNN
jgi:hypothetical protein